MDYHWRAADSTPSAPVADALPAAAAAPGPPPRPKWIPVSLSGKGVRVDISERTDGRFVDAWGQVWGGIPGEE